MTAKIILNNQDDIYNSFIKLLISHNLIDKQPNNLLCKKGYIKPTLTNKFNKIQLDYFLINGIYSSTYNGNTFSITIKIHQQPILTTECRILNFVKQAIIQGQSLPKIKEFIKYVLTLQNSPQEKDQITIYQNNGGHWRISKQKKPRKLQSVIFEPQFIKSILEDINQFIASQQWYISMGIPYKRSYLLYGPPGTGKSSFAQALAAHIGFSICFVNCSDKISDYNFNILLNQTPKQSVILIEDVDSIFSQRKNTEKINALTFSGFLNSIDGVRSQQGRIIIMTTNYKDRLDPALLRPGRVDEVYEIGYSSRYQIQKLCYRFYQNDQLAKKLANALPQRKLSMSLIQGYLLKYRKNPQGILGRIDDILQNDENVKIDQYLSEINCIEALNDFKMEQCYSLATAKNLPKVELEKILTKLNSLQKGRLLETIRQDRKMYIKSETQIKKFIQQSVQDEETQRILWEFAREKNATTFFVIRDKLKELNEKKTEP